ncbi:MAG TPA: hypothetical protein VF424_17845 [Vicinamibacterales bacterium]
MSLKDKLEIGLKPDAPYRPDNLPDFQLNDPACREGATPGKAATTEEAREECDEGSPPRRMKKKLTARRVAIRRTTAVRTAATRRRTKKPRTAARSRPARGRR